MLFSACIYNIHCNIMHVYIYYLLLHNNVLYVQCCTNICITLYLAGVYVGFEETMYTVTENSSTPVVISVMDGGVTLDRNITIDFVTDTITAKGIICNTIYLLRDKIVLLRFTMYVLQVQWNLSVKTTTGPYEVSII